MIARANTQNDAPMPLLLALLLAAVPAPAPVPAPVAAPLTLAQARASMIGRWQGKLEYRTIRRIAGSGSR